MFESLRYGLFDDDGQCSAAIKKGGVILGAISDYDINDIESANLVLLPCLCFHS